MKVKTITKGNILIARPNLNESTFNRSVILITEHNSKGSIGFIINKPLTYSVKNYISELDSNLIVHNGGPVETSNLYYLHSRPDLIKDSEPITDKLFWSGDYNDVRSALNNNIISKNDIKFYLGYTGWGENQLQAEMNDNAWTMVNNPINIFEDWNNNLWRNQMKKLGGENLLWVNTPADPSMN